VKPLLREEVIEVVAGYAPRNLRVALADEIAVAVAQRDELVA
jgi:hypothetical protein